MFAVFFFFMDLKRYESPTLTITEQLNRIVLYFLKYKKKISPRLPVFTYLGYTGIFVLIVKHIDKRSRFNYDTVR